MSEPENPETPQPVPPAAAPPSAPAAKPAAPPPARKPASRGQRSSREPREPRHALAPTLEIEERFTSAPRLQDLDAEIESELQAALGDFSDEAMLGDTRPKPSGADAGPQQRRKTGKVMSVHGADVFVDVPGGRSQGVLSMTQFPDGPPAPGTEVEFEIDGYDGANGLLLLSRKGAAVVADWSSVAIGMVVEARVTATNKGGLEVDVNGIRGFLPISQVDLYRVENAEQFVNQRLLCMVAEVNPSERNLVVSRRALLEREREEAREKFWQEVAEGQIRDGIVRSVREFGAFVDLGGADGLLHVSEMSWSRVADPTALVQPGQALKVVVLRVDREKRKLSLGLKQLLASPWDNIAEKYPHSHLFMGKVTKLMEFGAFVELEPGVEGLIHISELAPQRVRKVSDIVQEGQEVQVMVLRVDAEQRKISLSLKAALAEAEDTAATDEDADEAAEDVKPQRPRTFPLRGGIGGG